jgi:hypothetical protein
MSMLHTGAPYRRDDRQTIRVPVVMPLVEVDVDENGFLSVTLDHEPYSAQDSLTRDDLKRVVDDIADDLGTAVRVEVREADRSAFTDIVTPSHRAVPETPSKPATVKPRPVEPEPVKLIRGITTSAGEVTGDGFLPNEDVAGARIVAHQPTTTDGTARLRLPPALLEAHPGLVVFMGRESGTVLVSSSTSGSVSGGAA